MRVFVTGIAGFLGSWIADWYLDKGYSVVGIDNMSGGSHNNIPDRAKYYYWDFTNPDIDSYAELMKGCDVLYHCGAAPYEGVSVFSPGFICNNIFTGSINSFSAAIKAGIKRIVYCSSMARYGCGQPPFMEIDRPKPQDPYGIAKEAAERVLIHLSDVHSAEWNIAVPHNIYGPRQYYYDPYRNVASIFANAMLQNITPIIYGDGMQERSLSYITDCVEPLAKMGISDEVNKQIINIGPDDNELTINDLYAKIANITGFNRQPIYMPDRPKEVKEAYCSSRRAREILNYETKVDIDTGLNNLVEWIRQQGPRPFNYRKIGLEIINDKTPKNWTDHLLKME